jgi:hypothetical protein
MLARSAEKLRCASRSSLPQWRNHRQNTSGRLNSADVVDAERAFSLVSDRLLSIDGHKVIVPTRFSIAPDFTQA